MGAPVGEVARAAAVVQRGRHVHAGLELAAAGADGVGRAGVDAAEQARDAGLRQARGAGLVDVEGRRFREHAGGTDRVAAPDRRAHHLQQVHARRALGRRQRGGGRRRGRDAEVGRRPGIGAVAGDAAILERRAGGFLGRRGGRGRTRRGRGSGQGHAHRQGQHGHGKPAAESVHESHGRAAPGARAGLAAGATPIRPQARGRWPEWPGG